MSNPDAVVVPDDCYCKTCNGRTRAGAFPDDKLRVACDKAFDHCVVIPGEKEACVRCIWRYGEPCDFEKRPYVVKERKPMIVRITNPLPAAPAPPVTPVTPTPAGPASQALAQLQPALMDPTTGKFWFQAGGSGS